jgi:hypothetical protein
VLIEIVLQCSQNTMIRIEHAPCAAINGG